MRLLVLLCRIFEVPTLRNSSRGATNPHAARDVGGDQRQVRLEATGVQSRKPGEHRLMQQNEGELCYRNHQGVLHWKVFFAEDQWGRLILSHGGQNEHYV